MIFENIEVNHIKFGPGIVVATQGKYMTIQFSNTKKTFVYPDAFENFLTLADGSVSDEIKCDIEKANKVKQQILHDKEEENKRAMTRGIVIPGKQINPNEQEDEESVFKSSEKDEEI